MTIKKCCGTCKYLSKYTDTENRHHCITPPPEKMPYWMNWYTSIVRKKNGTNCNYYEPKELST